MTLDPQLNATNKRHLNDKKNSLLKHNLVQKIYVSKNQAKMIKMCDIYISEV